MKRHTFAYILALIARISGFVLAVEFFGWDADPPSIAICFQCIYSFFLVIILAVVAFISETIFENYLHLNSWVQIILCLMIYVIIGIAYAILLFPDKTQDAETYVAVITSVVDIIFPGAIYYFSLHFQKYYQRH